MNSLLKPTTSFSWWKPVLFLIVVVIGLFIVKWQPYYAKSFIAAATHNIGSSIIPTPESSPLIEVYHFAERYFLAVWKAAVLGIILGSLVQVLIPRSWLMTVMGEGRFKSVLMGTLFSLPSMMCTCCAAPVAAGMRRQSISSGAAIAFWIGNPLLNPATLIFMGFVLGWDFAAIRLLAGTVIVLSIAMLVQRWVNDDLISMDKLGEQIKLDAKLPFLSRWLKALWQLFWSVVPIYVLTVLLLGAARAWLFPHLHESIDNTLVWVIIMAIAGCLFVIPTAAEIPIVQAMLVSGAGIGPALALLITLPAVSLPSLLMMRNALTVRTLWLIAILVIISGIIVGSFALI